MNHERTNLSLTIVACVLGTAALYLVWPPFPSFVSSVFTKTYDVTHPAAVRKAEFVSALRAGGNGNGEATFDALVALGADPATIQTVRGSTEYIRDAKSVYWVFPKPRKVEGVDPNSFKVWEDGTYRSNIGVDREHLYITGVLAEGVDPKTFARVGRTQYFHDEQSVFYEVRIDVKNDYRYGLRKIIGADPATMRAFTSGIGYDQAADLFVADAARVYLRGEALPGIDAKTFHMLASRYFADKNSTYFFNGDIDTIPTRIGPAGNFRTLTTLGYFAIDDQMYFGTTTIPGGDPTSFRVFDNEVHYGDRTREVCKDICPYAADAGAVYYDGKKINGADPSSFELIGYGLLQNKGKDPSDSQPEYARDAQHVYFIGKLVAGADPRTFRPLVSGGYFYGYGRDSLHVYWLDKEIVGADPTTFRIFDGQQPYEGCGVGPYSADARAVYFETKQIVGADPSTFKPIINEYGRDKNGVWKGTVLQASDFTPECTYG